MTAKDIRFWSKVDTGSADRCWLWTGTINERGYGRFWDGTRHVRAHRYAYESLVGPIPDGHELDHVRARGCTHRHCVNPAHLEPVLHQENMRRASDRPTCRQGHPFTPENTITRPTQRLCRTCDRARKRRYIEKTRTQEATA